VYNEQQLSVFQVGSIPEKDISSMLVVTQLNIYALLRCYDIVGLAAMSILLVRDNAFGTLNSS